jgi:RimJ/RimL family protein N-acetyltransferase
MMLSTPRLILRKFTAEDVADLYALNQDAEVRRYVDGGRPLDPWEVYGPRMTAGIAAFPWGPELGFWTARFADGTFAGWFHLRPNEKVFPGEMELGYRLARRFWGQGLATEGSVELLRHAFSRLGLAEVMATALAANLGSRRVMEKVGMRLECAFVYPEALAPFWNESERAAVKYVVTREVFLRERTGAEASEKASF